MGKSVRSLAQGVRALGFSNWFQKGSGRVNMGIGYGEDYTPPLPPEAPVSFRLPCPSSCKGSGRQLKGIVTGCWGSSLMPDLRLAFRGQEGFWLHVGLQY